MLLWCFNDSTNRQKNNVNKTFLQKCSSARTRLKISEQAASVERKLLKDLQKAWSPNLSPWKQNVKKWEVTQDFREWHGELGLGQFCGCTLYHFPAVYIFFRVHWRIHDKPKSEMIATTMRSFLCVCYSFCPFLSTTPGTPWRSWSNSKYFV